MFGIGPLELIITATVILLVVGPAKLPQLMRQAGRFFVYARRYSSELRDEFNKVVREVETEIRIEETAKLREQIQKELRDSARLIDAETADEIRDHPEQIIESRTPESEPKEDSEDDHTDEAQPEVSFESQPDFSSPDIGTDAGDQPKSKSSKPSD